jgi:hypothetical protein
MAGSLVRMEFRFCRTADHRTPALLLGRVAAADFAPVRSPAAQEAARVQIAPLIVRPMLSIDEFARCADLDASLLRTEIAASQLEAVRVGTRILRIGHGTARDYLRRRGLSDRRLRDFDKARPTMTLQDVVGVADVAAFLGVTPQHVRNLLATGELARRNLLTSGTLVGPQWLDRRVDGRWFGVERSDLLLFLEAHSSYKTPRS